MHIGILQAYFARTSVGGGEIHTESLARALLERGHAVTIHTDEPTDLRGGIDDLDVRRYDTPAKINPINELALAQRAFDDLRGCDVVLLTDDSAWRGVDLPIPTVMVFHIVWHGWVRRHRPLYRVLRRKPQALLYRHLEKKITNGADAVVSISPNIREDIRLTGVDEDKIVDIPNGVDLDRFAPSRGSYDEFTAYFQGRLIDMKNPDLLVEAAAQSEEDWRVLIGGDGPLRGPLEAAVARQDLADRVEFLGYVPDAELPERYAKADVFVLPSAYEGMPLTVLEAAASGTAIVASPRAATDFVTGEVGTVVEPDATAIAAALDDLSRNRDRTTRLGTAARRRAEGYSWAEIADRYESLFKGSWRGRW